MDQILADLIIVVINHLREIEVVIYEEKILWNRKK